MGSLPLPCADYYNRGLSITETSKLVAEHGPKKRKGEKKKDIKKVRNKVQNHPEVTCSI